jgi:hypothetical protein
LLGFVATLGITLYDQRNSELYNALIHRAKHLEEEFGVKGAPRSLKQVTHGGQFNERPIKARGMIFEAGHDLALALIYGPLLGAWFFPIVMAPLLLAGIPKVESTLIAAEVAGLAGILFTVRLVALDNLDKELYDAAANPLFVDNQLREGSFDEDESKTYRVRSGKTQSQLRAHVVPATKEDRLRVRLLDRKGVPLTAWNAAQAGEPVELRWPVKRDTDYLVRVSSVERRKGGSFTITLSD